MKKENLFSSSGPLLSTLQFYTEEANLSEIQKEILQLKIQKKKNEEIAKYINEKYNTTYTINYISTIFRQKIIPKISEIAILHEKIIFELFFPEEFKACSCCGTVLLRDLDFFVKKSRAKDGLTSQCKRCDKIARELRKRRS